MVHRHHHTPQLGRVSIVQVVYESTQLLLAELAARVISTDQLKFLSSEAIQDGSEMLEHKDCVPATP
jgi:hypothetical protein